MAGEVVTQGNKMPVGADVSAKDRLRVWVNSVHPVLVESKLADRLIDAGYVRLPGVYSVTEQKLIDSFEVKEGHAVQFVQAAERVRRDSASEATTIKEK